ncbi:iron complex outermembrane receptor protein [Xanthomonas arboricola]|nr:iron complex outermembrane receptor protein [Xanthomonas cannabis]NIK63390.1 iron complex outermembrane receptor protein [Xanthomonas cannabis]
MSTTLHRLTAALAMGLTCAQGAHAADAPQDDSVLTLGKVQATAVSNGTLAAHSVFSSVDVLGADLLQNQKVDFSWELFARAPGVQVTQFKVGTEAGRFSFRGFNAEGRVNAVKLLIDGVPGNDNLGGMPYMDMISPLDIEAIEIVRGTNDPRYGLNAIAGDVNVVTRSGGNDGTLSLATGSFGTYDVQAAKGFEQGGWSQNYFVGWRSSEGYRDHALAIKRNFAAKWLYTDPDARWRAGLSTRFYHATAQEAGFLTFQQAQQAPRSSPAFANTDQSERQLIQTVLHADGTLGQDWSWTAKTYVNRYQNERFVRFVERNPQQERVTNETHHGVIAGTTWRPELAGFSEFALEAGVDAQWQDNVSQRYRTVERERVRLLRDWDYSLDTRGAYLQLVMRPTERLKLVPAYRIDQVRGSFLDALSGTRFSTYDFGSILQPKFSAAYRLSDRATAYANWGRTWQIGGGNGAYRTQARNLRPSINDGWESGLKFQPWSWADARLAYWEQRASGEVARVIGVNGAVAVDEVSNVGRTLRRGWDAQLNLQPSERWRAWLAYSRQKAQIVVADPSAPDTRGKEVENVPNWLLTGGVDYQASDRLKFSLWGNGQGDYYIDRANTLGRYGGYVIGNVSATWQVNPRNELSLQIKNVTDKLYVYGFFDSGISGFTPADGRGVYAAWNLTF